MKNSSASFATRRHNDEHTAEHGPMNNKNIQRMRERNLLDVNTTSCEPDYSYRYLLSEETQARLAMREGR